MSTSRLDTYIPDYIYAMPVTNGVTVYGPLVALYGASGFSVQGLCQGGAAGSMTIFPTNHGSPSMSSLWQANGQPFGEYTVNQGIAANGHAGMKVTSTDSPLYFAAFYVGFTPTASGILYISLNVRRPSA